MAFPNYTKAVFFIMFNFSIMIQNSKSQDECNQYVEENLKNDKCAQLDANSHLVYTDSCIDKQICQWDGINDGICINRQNFPGEKCQLKFDCLSNECEQQKCKGKEHNEQCKEHSDCDPGMFCDNYEGGNNTCQFQKPYDESCHDIWECENQLVCDGNICIKPFSGGSNDDCQNFELYNSSSLFLAENFTWVCSSLYCIDNKCNDSPPAAVNQPPYECTNSSNCEIIGSNDTGTCECGVQSQNKEQYCSVQLGDDISKTFRDDWDIYVVPYLQRTQGQCNTLSRFRLQCQIAIDEQITKLIIAFSGVLLYDILPMINLGFNEEQIVDSALDVLSEYQEFDLANQMIEASQCAKYVCVDNIEGGYCYDPTADIVQIINECPILDETCLMQSEAKSQTCQKEYEYLLNSYPGLYCRWDYDCIAQDSKCENYRCTGKANDTECQNADDYSCDVGFACIKDPESDKYKCQPQIQIDQEECENDYQCVNNAVCRGGKCYKLFSVTTQQSIVNASCDSQDAREYACSSFTCEPSKDDQGNDVMTCVNPYQTQGTMPKEANSDWDCRSTNLDSYIAFSYVHCDYAQDGKSYCSAHTGDTVTLDYIDYLKDDNFNNDQGICHSFRRLSPICWQYERKERIEMMNDFIEAKERYFNYPSTDLASECTLQTLFVEYSKARDDEFIAKEYPLLDCDIHECASSAGQTLPEYECKNTFDNDTWLYEPCEDGKVCLQNNQSIGDCFEEPTQTAYAYPGMHCETILDCKASVECIGEQCSGKSNFQACNGPDDQSCVVGMACILYDQQNYACQQQIPSGSNQECENNYQCQNNALCRNKNCIKYFSLPTGSQFVGACSVLQYLQDEACQTMTCTYNETLDISTCIEPFDSDGRVCGYDSDCEIYNSQNFKVKETCQCSYNGTAFCRAYSNSKVAQSYKKYLELVIDKDQGLCHSYARLYSKCWEEVFHDQNDINLIYEYEAVYLEYKDFPFPQTADICVKEIDLPQYYDVTENTHSAAGWTMECSNFRCGTNDEEQNFQDKQCVLYDSNDDVYQIQICEDDDYYCPPFENKTNVFCEQISTQEPEGSLFPGDSCQNSTNCIQNVTCEDGKCKGKGVGELCSNQFDPICDVGLFCITNETDYLCQNQISIGGDCESDYQCVNYAVCRNDKCTEYFSILVNTTYTGLICGDDRIDLACETMTCDNVDHEQSRCIAPFNITKNQKCSNNIDCHASNGEGSVMRGQCRCSHDNDHQSYCQIGTMSEEANNYKKSFKEIYKEDQDVCHSLRRRQYDCWRGNYKLGSNQMNNVYDYIEKENEFYNFPMVQKADECTLNVYYHDYWEAKYGEGNGSMLVLNLVMLLVVLFT